jgi:K+-sensing histidine kinase KdpD
MAGVERVGADSAADKLAVLTEVARALASRLELPELLQAVTERITRSLEPAGLAAVFLWDPAAGLLRPQAISSPGLHGAQALYDLTLQEGESVAGRVFADGRTRLLNGPDEVLAERSGLRPASRQALARAYGADTLPRSVVAASLHAGQSRYGVLILESLAGPAAFSEGDVPFVEALADLIALEIDRGRQDREIDAARHALEAERLRSEITASLSHELRTPLAAVKGYATALLMNEVEWSASQRQEFLRLIDEETNNLNAMIAELLDSALVDIGRLQIEPEPVRLPILARELINEWSHRTEAHRFLLDFPPGFPIVDVDPRRIRQVIRNILDNAVKYSPAGGLVMFRGEVRPQAVVVSISDQGVGISPEDLIPLFDKYFRVKAPTGYHVPGTGLGLPVSRAIVEAHGGRIWAESRVHEGTTLYFSIPRHGLSNEEMAE